MSNFFAAERARNEAPVARVAQQMRDVARRRAEAAKATQARLVRWAPPALSRPTSLSRDRFLFLPGRASPDDIVRGIPHSEWRHRCASETLPTRPRTAPMAIATGRATLPPPYRSS